MKKFLLFLLFAAPVGAQTIAPSQIKPSTNNGDVVTTVAGKTAWAPGSSGGAVASVFGRTGVVVAAPGDYNCAQVTSAVCSLPALFNQTVELSGVPQAQRPSLNLIPGAPGSVTCVDNPITNTTDCTITGGGGSGDTWSIADVTGSRSIGVVYQNTTANPMYIGGTLASTGFNVLTIAQGPTPLSLPFISNGGAITTVYGTGFTAVIMPGYYYMLSVTESATTTVSHWTQITGSSGGGGGGTTAQSVGSALSGAVGGTANAVTLVLTTATPGIPSGTIVQWIPTAANTGAATLAVNPLGAVALDKCGATALVAGDMANGVGAQAMYDGAKWQLQNPQAGACSGGGSTAVNVNGAAVSSPNFNGSSPSPDVGYVAGAFKVSGSNVLPEIPMAQPPFLRATRCNGGSATAGDLSVPSTNAPPQGCNSVDTSSLGYLQFQAGTTSIQTAQSIIALPASWTTLSATLTFYALTTSGSPTLNIQAACAYTTSGNITSGPAYGSAVSHATTVSGTAGVPVTTVSYTLATNGTTPSCGANSLVYLQISRPTGDSGPDAYLLGMQTAVQ